MPTTTVFNTTIGQLESKRFGSNFPDYYSQLIYKIQVHEAICEFFEQLLLFDKVSFKSDIYNFSLQFLIRWFGIERVQRWIESGMIEFILWSPMIVRSKGIDRGNGYIDESVLFNRPPLVSGHFGGQEVDPAFSNRRVLQQLEIPKYRIDAFNKATNGHYIIPNERLSTQSVDMIVDAYNTNKLSKLGLPYRNKYELLNNPEKDKLFKLGHDVLETAILAEYQYKSYNKYEYTEISSASFDSIGSALGVREGSKMVLEIDNVPNLKSMFFNHELRMEDVERLRNKPTSKAFRNWLNTVDTSQNASEISSEYLDEITGKRGFLQTKAGAVLKNISMVGVGGALGTAISGIEVGAGIGVAGSYALDLGLGLFDTLVLDGLLKGPNPRMFAERIKRIRRV